MKLKLGQIWSNEDVSQLGRLMVKIDEFDHPVEVKYVTPYKAGDLGGIVAIPEIGSKILLCQTDDYTSGWFYLGTVVALPLASEDANKVLKGDTGQPIVGKETYRAKGVPQRLSIKTPLGNEIVLSESRNKEYFNTKAELKSITGKKVSLIDGGGPDNKLDCILIRNEHGDKIKLTTKGDTKSAARSVEIDTTGPQKLTSRTSQIDILVQDGRELNFINNSTGVNRAPFVPDSQHYGNVNIESKYRDVNVTSRNGRVFIDALGIQGLIQIDAENRIIIFAGGDCSIISRGNINLIADSNINLASGGEVNIRGDGGVNIDGNEIHLNSGKANPPRDINKGINHYGN